MATLASLVVPVAHVQIQRSKEQQLRYAVHEIRLAIDAYKKAGDEGRIRREAGATGYPKTLNLLVDGEVDQRDPEGKNSFFCDESHASHFMTIPTRQMPRRGQSAHIRAKRMSRPMEMTFTMYAAAQH